MILVTEHPIMLLVILCFKWLPTYIYIYIYWEKLKNKVIQSDEVIVEESWRYNISVLIKHLQDF